MSSCYTRLDHLSAFASAMADNGLRCSDQIIDDGNIHRFTLDTDKPKSNNGWYVLFGERVPAGAFGSWKTGEQHTWCAMHESELSDTEREENRRRVEDSKRQRELEREQRQTATASQAVRLWGDALPASPDHTYLVNKHVKPCNLRQSGNVLLVPLLHQGKIVNLQRIYPDGTKRFLSGGRVTGCYYVIQGSSDTLYLCEGAATGHTIHAIKGASVACAMNAGNLLPVARYFRGTDPELKIIVAADNDHRTPGNPGKTKGIEAAQAIEGLICWPTFPEGSTGTDFNDLANMEVTA